VRSMLTNEKLVILLKYLKNQNLNIVASRI
jgi:hypothetical protein